MSFGFLVLGNVIGYPTIALPQIKNETNSDLHLDESLGLDHVVQANCSRTWVNGRKILGRFDKKRAIQKQFHVLQQFTFVTWSVALRFMVRIHATFFISFDVCAWWNYIKQNWTMQNYHIFCPICISWLVINCICCHQNNAFFWKNFNLSFCFTLFYINWSLYLRNGPSWYKRFFGHSFTIFYGIR